MIIRKSSYNIKINIYDFANLYYGALHLRFIHIHILQI